MKKWLPEDVPDCFYRVSVKALILDENRDKFLIMQEANGWWEVPGGGLEFGEEPQVALKREISEEMGVEISKIADTPSYFTTGTKNLKGHWNVGVVYETTLEHLNFTPTDECVAIKFIGKEDEDWLQSVSAYDSVLALYRVFNKS